VLLVDDEDAVEELAADGADEALGDGIRSGCPRRRSDDLYVDGGEDGVEGGGELGVAVPDENPELAAGVVEVHGQLRASCVSHAAVGCAVTPRKCTWRVACSMTKNA